MNVSGQTLNLQGWTLWCSAVQNGTHTSVAPFTSSVTVADGEFIVIGDAATPPAEMVGGQYVDSPQNIPYVSSEYDCALYDNLGRLVDLVRTTGHDDEVVHNQGPFFSVAAGMLRWLRDYQGPLMANVRPGR
ncbi:MAG: hypothetical protein CMJ83_16275 [Planctomycetes bacterium]|nr:hypothetical protein [Planctomycetota bacterium]